MKIRNLLYTGLISLLFGACSSSKDKDIPSIAVDGHLTIRASIASLGGTKAVDEAVLGGATSKLKTVHLAFLKGNSESQRVLRVSPLLPEQIEKLISSKGLSHYDESKQITGVLLMVNASNASGVTKDMTISEVTKHVGDLNFTRIQPGKDEETSGIKNVPNFGVDKMLLLASDGNYFANIVLKPLISRIQVHKAVVADPKTVKDLKVTRLFLDNFIEDNSNPMVRFSVGTSAGADLDAVLSKFKSIFEFEDGGILNFDQMNQKKNYAYHVFPQTVLPSGSNKSGVNLILRLDYFDIDRDKNSTSYATLRLATASGSNLNEGSVEIEAAKLYNIDLGKIDWDGNGIYEPDKDKFKPEYGSETPNGDKMNLATIVTITPWDVLGVIPSPF